LRGRLTAPATNPTQPLYVSAALPQTARVMVKDEDVCVHCGLCAERCPTAAWDMQKSSIRIPHAIDEEVSRMPSLMPDASRVNDFVIKFANVNGTGSASANSLIMKAIFRMGVPVTGKNYFPVEHPGPADLV
jgi:ferredoxin